MSSIFQDKHLFTAYELARTGCKEEDIAKGLHVSLPTFLRWERVNPLFKLSIKMARRVKKQSEENKGTFQNYIYKRLPDELKDVWKEVMRVEKEGKGLQRLESILAERGVRARQILFLHSWVSSNYSLLRALRRINISRGTFELWKRDPDFSELVEQVEELKKDYFEESFVNLVASGSEPATIHAVKTKCRDRGYGDALKVDVSGELSITHSFVKMKDLDLPLSVRKQILCKIKEKKALTDGDQNDNPT